jgi:hypothetical protein
MLRNDAFSITEVTRIKLKVVPVLSYARQLEAGGGVVGGIE